MFDFLIDGVIAVSTAIKGQKQQEKMLSERQNVTTPTLIKDGSYLDDIRNNPLQAEPYIAHAQHYRKKGYDEASIEILEEAGLKLQIAQTKNNALQIYRHLSTHLKSTNLQNKFTKLQKIDVKIKQLMQSTMTMNEQNIQEIVEQQQIMDDQKYLEKQEQWIESFVQYLNQGKCKEIVRYKFQGNYVVSQILEEIVLQMFENVQICEREKFFVQQNENKGQNIEQCQINQQQALLIVKEQQNGKQELNQQIKDNDQKQKQEQKLDDLSIFIFNQINQHVSQTYQEIKQYELQEISAFKQQNQQAFSTKQSFLKIDIKEEQLLENKQKQKINNISSCQQQQQQKQTKNEEHLHLPISPPSSTNINNIIPQKVINKQQNNHHAQFSTEDQQIIPLNHKIKIMDPKQTYFEETKKCRCLVM